MSGQYDSQRVFDDAAPVAKEWAACFFLSMIYSGSRLSLSGSHLNRIGCLRPRKEPSLGFCVSPFLSGKMAYREDLTDQFCFNYRRKHFGISPQ